jgi:carboxypeptidase D
VSGLARSNYRTNFLLQPGCSSLGSVLQGNGPFLWPAGTYKPFFNRWSWHRLTNVVFIDQPIGTGFSQGTVTATNEKDVAQQFLGFWRNFINTFSMKGYRVYIASGSYGGMFAPYIASAMLDTNDTIYSNVSGMLIFDGLFSTFPLAQDIPLASFVNRWKDIFAFNNSFTQYITDTAQECGYLEYMNKWLTFPSSGVQPST